MKRLVTLLTIEIFVHLPISCLGSDSPAKPLTQEAYIWQRTWTAPLCEAISQHAAQFSGLVALSAEISWAQKRPQLVRVSLNYEVLRAANRPVGLALRIGPFSGPFAPNDETITALSEIAASLLKEAKHKSLEIKELQIDFDCAESKLDGYRIWVEAIRKKVAPVRVVITALPSWLSQSSFKKLASAADGFILQVHSLEKPKDFRAPFTLCDISAAKLSVERAARLGFTFRVALPTYGYLTAFDINGRFIGLSAEGPDRDWPAGTQVRPVRSEAGEIAGLVKDWKGSHPSALTGIIWYRFPISLDSLNWPWPTLFAVMAGRSPRESFRAEVVRPEKGLVEISLVNDGEADLSSRPVIEVRWRNNRLVAADGLRDFVVVDSGPKMVQFKSKTTLTSGRLLPGERQVIGWLRFNEEAEVAVEIKKL